MKYQIRDKVAKFVYKGKHEVIYGTDVVIEHETLYNKSKNIYRINNYLIYFSTNFIHFNNHIRVVDVGQNTRI